MDKKKKRNLNLSIIISGLMCKGFGIICLYCIIVGIFILDPFFFGIGIMFLFLGLELVIINNQARIQKLELQQKGW